MNPARSPGAWPFPFRMAAALCLLLTVLQGFLSAYQALWLSEGEPAEEHAALQEHQVDPSVAQAVEAWTQEERSFGDGRVALLTVYALTCTLTFLAAARLLRHGPLPREGVRRLLVGGAFTAAALRTIDGAQQAVMAHRAAPAFFQALHPEGVGLPQFSSALSDGPAVLTALVAGLWVLLGVYFSSGGVRELVRARDAQLEES